ncbi:acyl-homoserine-lactone synthase [Bradyrhizobium brasilense]|uniref:acyl-homoserine-lactone synthase n=1 Tax=Bradyrhizobium brasilense TaxID=1419277 RepID=A0ABY8JMF0_9BRAD|nr:acyl-homoserine-lactone synthase [Bradyrhizobium brasilense]WFU66847.1 acyl-homoserine-lactone synthase [Bradyrhizobium brasilense]
MYVIALSCSRFGQHLDLLKAMFRLRRRVFKDRLDWNVSVSGEFELDIYDVLKPVYLLCISEERNVVGSVRLLPTTGPTMLADTFPSLLGGRPAPRNEKVLESSRYCIDANQAGELVRNGLNRATLMLFAAMIEYLQIANAEAIVTVTDTRLERILRRAGWPLERMAAPHPLGSSMALAGFLHRCDEALAAMRRSAGVEGPVLVDPDWLGRVR